MVSIPTPGRRDSKHFLSAFASEDQVRVRELFENAIRDKADFETDYRIVHPGGAIRNIHAVGHPVCDEVGNLVEFVGTVIDITESKRAEEALRASEQVARGQVEALAQSLDVLATAPDAGKVRWADAEYNWSPLECAKRELCGYSTNRMTHLFCD